MITEHDLQEAIAECEGQRNPTSSTCMKLAAFYTIQDRMFPKQMSGTSAQEPMFYSRAEEPVESKAEYESNTEFGQAIYGMDRLQLLSIIDELMTTLKVISPRLYDGVMRKIDPSY